MIQSLSDFFIYFSRITRLDISPVQNFEYINIVILFLVLWVGLFGVKIYRLLFAVITLVIFILVTVLLFESRMDWLYVASIFSIFSIIFAFLSFFLKKISAFFFVGLIAFVYLNGINSQLILTIVLSGILGILAYLFPFVTVLISTVFLGSIETTMLLDQQSKPILHPVFLGIIIILVCSVFQLYTNKEGMNLIKKLKGETYG